MIPCKNVVGINLMLVFNVFPLHKRELFVANKEPLKGAY